MPCRHVAARIEDHFGFRIRGDQFSCERCSRKVGNANTVTYDGVEVFSGHFQPIDHAALTGWASPFLHGELVPFLQAVGWKYGVVAVPDVLDSESV